MFGSFENRMAERVISKVPVIGMGAFLSLYSDRYPYTVTELSKDVITVTFDTADAGKVTRTYPKWIIAVEDEVRLVSGSAYDGSAQYEYSEGDKTRGRKFIFHKSTGLYREETKNIRANAETESIEYVGVGRTNKSNTALILGYRDRYHDPSF